MLQASKNCKPSQNLSFRTAGIALSNQPQA